MDILSGYNSGSSVTGSVKINGTIRDRKQFRHLSAYIMQEQLLHPLLTVQEAMKFSANLKIGKEQSAEEKQQKVRATFFTHISTKGILIPRKYRLTFLDQ
jgi:ABC-type multidrug transport system ATPase subunit